MSEDPQPSVRFVTPRGRLVVLAALCLAVTAFGVVIVLLNLDNTPSLLIGVAAIGIFGIGGGVSIVNQLRTSTVLRADADGIHITALGTVPWSDVDRLGATAKGELGIRLRRPDALLNAPRSTMTRETLRENRARSGGYDVVFAERDLGTAATDAARSLRALQP